MEFLFVFILGAIVGSFLNVVICRVPAGKSILFPSSHCESCNKRLQPIDLLPIVSWVLLKGKCRYCGAKISIRYPLVECLTGMLFLLAYVKVGLDSNLLVYFLLTSVLIAGAFIDIDHQILPDKLHFFALIAYIILNALLSFIQWKDSLFGALAAMAPFLLLFLLTKGRGMGFGDVKFIAVIGLYIGLRKSILTVFLSFVLGGIFGAFLLITKVKGKEDSIPFGPWIAVAALIAMYWGDGIIAWYWS